MLAARQQLAANQTQTEGTTPAQHPSVLRATARVRETSLASQRVELLAPAKARLPAAALAGRRRLGPPS